MSSPPPKSLVPAPASTPSVWPPSNPSGTVIPFPLPWGQTGCCPPGGMDALMKCYCDIQQASAFIGQIMLDQINSNPAIIAAIIAGIEKSGSTLPTLGVTNGADAQPGQVGEYTTMSAVMNYGIGTTTVPVSVGILQPGDWDIWAYCGFEPTINGAGFDLSPIPAGVENGPTAFLSFNTTDQLVLISNVGRALISVPTLFVFSASVYGAAAAASTTLQFCARRAR